MTNKTLLIDCDGVLYPFSQLTLEDFVSAMKETYRKDVKIDGKTQAKISEETIAQNKLGMFNYIKAICDYTGYNFDAFCRQMFSRVDYGKITRDDALYRSLIRTAHAQPVIILTNNHFYHLNNVLHQRFGKSVFDFENNGIRCYDITASEKNGVFFPKHNPEGLAAFVQKIGVSASECIMLDDMERNIETAKKVGMAGVLIDEKFTLKQYLGQNLKNSIALEKEYE